MKRRLGQFAAMGGFVVLGAVVGVIIARTSDRITPEGAPLPVDLAIFCCLVLAFLAITMAHVALHEAGHGVCGALSGYAFVSYRIAGLMWIRREDERIHFARFSLAGTGGQCLMEPPGSLGDEYPVVLYNMGGSLANLLVALISFVFSRALSDRPIPSSLLLISALVGVVFALMNGVPLRTALVSNDGMNTLELMRSPVARRSLWVQMKANACLARGQRLRDLPADWFTLPSADEMGSSLVASLATLAANRLMDERRFEETADLIRDILAHPGATPELHQRLLWCDLATCLLLLGRQDEAAALMDDAHRRDLKPLNTQLAVLRTLYALALLADDDAAAAGQVRKDFDRIAQSYPYPCEVASERELLELVDRQASPAM